MDKKLIFDFLKDLMKNNSKEWMNKNRHRYIEAKNIWLNEIDLILKRLRIHDEKLTLVIPSDTISRINNNRRFHPYKPVYKDNFTFTPYHGIASASFHISVSPKYSFMGGGLYQPDSKKLNKVRAAIDRDGQIFVNILNEKRLVNLFGRLDHDDEELKSAPRGYSGDHKYIDLLRRKNFTSIIHLTYGDVISDNFVDLVEEAFVIIKPLVDYLNDAINFEK
jgi:uncharacterized protein (TIGR02453 family)